MPASNIKIEAKWKEAVTAKVTVRLVFEDLDGKYVPSEHSSQVIGNHNGEWKHGEKVTLKSYTDTNNNPVTHTPLNNKVLANITI